MTSIIAFDPGLVTGVAWGSFTDEDALVVEGRAHIRYEDFVFDAYDYLTQIVTINESTVEMFYRKDIVVCEKFTVRTNNEFNPDTHALKVEGIIDVLFPPRKLVMRDRTMKTQVPDSILKEHGLWATGTDVDWEDGRDSNDAVIHMLGHVAKTLGHLPTLRKYFR